MKEVMATHEAISLEERKAQWKYLDRLAWERYKHNRWVNDFTDYELALLWAGCLITNEQGLGRAYDDEVYDEIKGRTYEDEIFNMAEHYYGMGVTL